MSFRYRIGSAFIAFFLFSIWFVNDFQGDLFINQQLIDDVPCEFQLTFIFPNLTIKSMLNPFLSPVLFSI